MFQLFYDVILFLFLNPGMRLKTKTLYLQSPKGFDHIPITQFYTYFRFATEPRRQHGIHGTFMVWLGDSGFGVGGGVSSQAELGYQEV